MARRRDSHPIFLWPGGCSNWASDTGWGKKLTTKQMKNDNEFATQGFQGLCFTTQRYRRACSTQKPLQNSLWPLGWFECFPRGIKCWRAQQRLLKRKQRATIGFRGFQMCVTWGTGMRYLDGPRRRDIATLPLVYPKGFHHKSSHHHCDVAGFSLPLHEAVVTDGSVDHQYIDWIGFRI